MTNNEYLEFPWSVEDTIENLKEIKEMMIAKVKAVNLHGKAERDAREVAFDFDRAISALEKQMPKTPNIWGDGYPVYDMYDCPNCGESYEIDGHKYDFCPNCGQHLDWRVEE